jgi:hypothetical protein
MITDLAVLGSFELLDPGSTLAAGDIKSAYHLLTKRGAVRQVGCWGAAPTAARLLKPPS